MIIHPPVGGAGRGTVSTEEKCGEYAVYHKPAEPGD